MSYIIYKPSFSLICGSNYSSCLRCVFFLEQIDTTGPWYAKAIKGSKHFHSMLTIEDTDVVYLSLAGQLDTLTVFHHSGDKSVVRCHYWVHREMDCLLIPQVFTRSPPLTTTCWWGSRKHVGQLCKMPWSNTCVPRDRILVPVKCRDLLLQ